MRKCPYCDGLVADGSTECGFCGKDLGPVSPEQLQPPPPVSTYSVGGPRNCVACGRPIPFDAGVCPYCGHDYRIPLVQTPVIERTWKPVVGGVLIIVAGILALAMGAMYMAMDASYLEDMGVDFGSDLTAEDLEAALTGCGVVLFIFAAIAFIGGFFGIRRKHFVVAIIGGIFGLLGVGFLLGSLLALVGLILVAVSRDEFD